MVFLYASGEAVQKGDRIRYAGGSGVVEFVAVPGIADPESDYFVEEFGGGCMILTERFGSIFLDDPRDEEDLEFVARAVGETAGVITPRRRIVLLGLPGALGLALALVGASGMTAYAVSRRTVPRSDRLSAAMHSAV